MSITMRDPHLDDETLVGLAGGKDSTAHDAHLAACAACAGRLGAVRRGAELLSVRLAADDSAPTAAERARTRAAVDAAVARRGTRGAWRRPAVLAAAAVVVLAGAAAAKPIRVWLAAHLAPAPARPAAPPAPRVPSTPAAVPRTTVRFETPGEELSVDVATSQRSGSIEVVADSATLSAVSIVGGRDETIVMLPGGVRIVNSGASGAAYRIATARGVHAVRLTIGATERVYRLAPGDTLHVTLASGPER